MYDDSVLSFPLWCMVRTTAVGSAVSRIFLFVFLFSGSQNTTYPRSKSSSLDPTAVGQGRIVWGRRSKVPLLVCLVESGAVPDRVSR